MKTSEGNLNNVFNYGMNTGQGLESAGASGVGAAQSYWNKLLSGNRQAQLAAAAPQINSATQTADAAKRQMATSGTARGGGTAGANQQANDKLQAQISNALFGVVPQAAQGAAQTGGTLLSAANNLLGLGENATATEGNIGLNQEKISNEAFQSAFGDLLGFGETAAAKAIDPSLFKQVV